MHPLKLLALALVSLLPLDAARGQGTPVTLSPTERRSVNVFLSNFAETSLPAFREGTMTDAVKINFALLHILKNRSRDVVIRGVNSTVRASAVDEVATRYLGSPVGRHRSINDGNGLSATFAGGQYTFPGADGELWTPYVWVTDLRRQPDGTLRVRFNQCGFMDGYSGSDVYATPLRRNTDDASCNGQGQARFRRVTEGGRSRYVLLEWQ